jgi:outer membrane protein, multidrug efflux system
VTPARGASLAAGVLLLAACTVGPDYRRPDLKLPDAYFEPAVENAGATAPDAIPQWWTLFGDARLNDLVAAAFAHNTDLELAAAQVAEAEAALREARAAQWPELDANAGAARARSSQLTPFFPQALAPINNDFKFGVSTAFELDFWGRLRRASEAARARLLATRYGRDVVALSLAAATVEGYLSLRSLDVQVDLTHSMIGRYDDTADIVSRRIRAGYASSLDQATTDAARASESAQLRELTRQRANVRHELAQLTGQFELELDPGDLMTLPIPPAPPPGVPSTLLVRRPDVREAEQNLVAANALIGVARASEFPTFSLTAALGQESDALGSVLHAPGRLWSVGAGVVGPVLDAGRYAARTAQAQARQRQAAATWRASVETAFHEVADALAGIRETTAAEADLKLAVEAAREAERIARSRYSNGYAGYFELLDAQRTVDAAQLAYVRNRQARLDYDVDLIKALGGGWQSETAS